LRSRAISEGRPVTQKLEEGKTMGNVEYIELDLEIKAETEKAYLMSDGDIDAWVPKSMVQDMEDLGGGTVVITIHEWLAEDKGFF
jgi:hypothetical protein